MKEAIVIAEIGCNHKGDMTIAKELIKMAKEYCHADVAKFQKRNNKELLTEEQYNAPHPNPMHAYGETYGEHREFLEFSTEQHAELKKYCEQLGIEYSTSVWDLTSAKEMTSISPSFLKIPSACNNNYNMLEWLCQNYKGEIHVSTGMTTKQETDDLIKFFQSQNRQKDVVLYHCTSGYPVAFEEVCLLEISELKKKHANEIKDIGFSGHHLGIAADIAAYALGANYMERHFTLDRTWKGTDHSASLEPDGLRKLCRDLKAVNKAMHYKEKDILDVEEVQRKKLKYRPA
jgi:sialic acid synthase